MAALSARLQWAGRLALRRLGWQGVGAVLLLAGSIMLAGWGRFVLQLRLDDAQAPAAVPAAAGPAEPVLPGLGQTAVLPGWLQQAAAGHGLELAQAQYELESGGARTRYRAVLPLNGDYAGLRGFLSATLNQYPNAALETLQIRRDSALHEELHMRVVLAFHLENRP